MILFFKAKFDPDILAVPPEWRLQTRVGWENSAIF